MRFALYVRSVCTFVSAFRGLGYHPPTCMSLKLRLTIDSNPIAPTIQSRVSRIHSTLLSISTEDLNFVDRVTSLIANELKVRDGASGPLATPELLKTSQRCTYSYFFGITRMICIMP